MEKSNKSYSEVSADEYVDQLMQNPRKHDGHPVLSRVTHLEESDLLQVINGSYIARRFFNRSSGWFSKKLNHCLNNGKPDEFTPAELDTLAKALRTLALELNSLADRLQ